MIDSTTASRATFPPLGRGVTIRLRLLALVVAAALPPVIFSMVQVRRADEQARANAEQAALQLATRVATRIDDHASVVDALLITLSHMVRPHADSREANDRLLASVSRELGARFLTLTLADTLGTVVGLSIPTPAGLTAGMADRQYFKDALRTRGLGIGAPMIGRVTSQHLIGMGRAIIGPAGRPTGVIAASSRLDELQSLLVPRDLPEGAVVTILNERGVVLARTIDGPNWVGRDITTLAATRAGLSGREAMGVVARADSVPRLSGFAAATRVPWQVFVGIPREVALRQVHALKREALVLGILSLLVSFGLAWLFSRRIAGPVRALTADANAFASGNLAHRTAVRASGELGQLAETFNRMAAALEGRRTELSESERRYRLLFDTLPLPMWVYDLQTLRFNAVNQAAIDRYGYSRDEFMRMTILDIRPESEGARLTDFTRTLKPGRTTRLPWRHTTKSGERIDVEITSDDLLAGIDRARLVVAIDVTDRNRIEAALHASQEQLRHSQKMEAVGSLAGGIAHDFNNLLTAILGYCDLALEPDAADVAVREDVLEIRRAAERAAELTHQLLAFSRRQMLKPSVFALNSAVEVTEKILRRLMTENIILRLDVAPVSPFIVADPAQVEQVILNLAVNARDAMTRGGRLILGTREIEFEAPFPVVGGTLEPGRYAALRVSDTGSGIPPEVRERMFEPFFTTKKRGHGTGLGLATAYGVIQQSGGGIGVHSVVGEGSTFTVYFPATRSVGSPPTSIRTHEPTARGYGTILLAEDDDAVRAITRATLERAGYLVLAAPDGASAVALADAHPGRIDLLLTDVIMPGMNGRELAERMMVRRPRLPVLFVSGYTDNVLTDLGLLSAESALLDKPFTPATLTAAVSAILGAERLEV